MLQYEYAKHVKMNVLFSFFQVVLKLDTPIVFANYSLGETGISRTAAVHSEDSLLFVAGNKVHFLKSALIVGGVCFDFSPFSLSA